MAGIWEIVVYVRQVIGHWLASNAEQETDNDVANTAGGASATATIVKGGIVDFLYLEVLDASFSFDDVIGAFAMSNDVVILMLRLALGAMFVRAMFVRSMTL